jgi:hypothetical protein
MDQINLRVVLTDPPAGGEAGSGVPVRHRQMACRRSLLAAALCCFVSNASGNDNGLALRPVMV